MQGKTIYDIDSIDMAYVYDLAYQCPTNPAVYNARAIVEVLLGEHIPPCPSGLYTKSMQVSDFTVHNNTEKEVEPILGDNYPEPFSSLTNIPYQLPDYVKGQIVIKDVLGRVLFEIEITSENNLIKLNTEKWAKGLYFYSLKINGLIIDSKKMIVNR